MTIFLFDMDGVLLTPGGYHKALAETILMAGKALGFYNLQVDEEDIAVFEACGVTSEWDSAAICAALLLHRRWTIDPMGELPASLVGSHPAPIDLSPPEFQGFFKSLKQTPGQAWLPLDYAEQAIFNQDGHLTNHQLHSLKRVLRSAREIGQSPTHQVFQEFVLGSELYSRYYHLNPQLHTESYLLKYDQSNWSSPSYKKFIDWMEVTDNFAAILTNRPSLMPGNLEGTPEAEIGAELVGLTQVPIVGWGGISWLGLQRGENPQLFCKPAPVHALAAMLVAQGSSIENSLQAALDLVIEGRIHPELKKLEGARVCVFEDSTGGFASALAAQEILQKIGFSLQLHLIGITKNDQKCSGLKAKGALIFPDLPAALEYAYQIDM
jgi:hypothetical protein